MGVEYAGLPDEAVILAAETAGWLKETGPAPGGLVLPDLDEGEAACIRIALSSPEPRLLLMDERAGRAIAIEHGLAVTGTAAIIGMAKTRGLIRSAREVFARLHGSDFRISASSIIASRAMPVTTWNTTATLSSARWC